MSFRALALTRKREPGLRTEPAGSSFVEQARRLGITKNYSDVNVRLATWIAAASDLETAQLPTRQSSTTRRLMVARKG